MKVKYQQKSKQKRNQIVSRKPEDYGWPKSNLLKSTLEIIFVTTTIPIIVVGITIFTTVEDFVLFNLMEGFILEWWNDR